MIKLFIFDLDGVLASTSFEHFKAWKIVLYERFKIEIEDEIEEKTKGVSRLESLNNILKAYQLEDSITQKEKAELAHTKNELYKNMISNFNESKLFFGVIEILKFLKSHQILIALGSASKNSKTIIKSTKIEQYFDYVVDPSSLKSKPSPDIFNDAMQHFKLKPDECIGVEDAISGIKAIKNANMYAIGIGSITNLHEADIVFNSINEIDFNFLEKLIGGKNG